MKLILKTIFDFIKFALISGILICVCIVIDIKTGANSNITDLFFLMIWILIVVLMGILSYRRHYIIFKKDDPRQNIASIVFITAGLLWMKFVTEWGVAFCYLFTVKHYMG